MSAVVSCKEEKLNERGQLINLTKQKPLQQKAKKLKNITSKIIESMC
jgi:hypothetical protein